MKADIYWIDGSRPGRLAVAQRPRGGDWLEDEVASWKRSGVEVVVSLLTEEEVIELDISVEESLTENQGLQFISLPIEDRGTPDSRAKASELANHLSAGRNVLIHCRQGIGRAGMIASSVLVLLGVDADTAMQRVGTARGRVVPETPEQRRWVLDFARMSLATSRLPVDRSLPASDNLLNPTVP